MVPLRIAVFLPAADGRPSLLSMIGPIKNANRPPHPSDLGAANELFTSELFLIVSSPDSLNDNSPGLPVIGLFGAGGLVVPVVNSITSGAALEPM